MSNEVAANAIRKFVQSMIGAYETGFVDKNNPTLAEIHQVAKNHIKDFYGIDVPDIIEEFGSDVAISCGMPEDQAKRILDNRKRVG